MVRSNVQEVSHLLTTSQGTVATKSYDMKSSLSHELVTWKTLPTEMKLEILKQLYHTDYVFESKWIGMTSRGVWIEQHQFVCATPPSTDATLVDRELWALGTISLSEISEITIDLCTDSYTPCPADLFSGSRLFKQLGRVAMRVKHLVLPTFASLNLALFQEKFQHLKSIKIVDVAPIYIEGCLHYFHGDNYYNDLDEVDVAKLSAITDNDYEILKIYIEEWLYAPGGTGGNVCGSIDQFLPSNLEKMNVYFTAAIKIDVEAEQSGIYRVPTDKLVSMSAI